MIRAAHARQRRLSLVMAMVLSGCTCGEDRAVAPERTIDATPPPGVALDRVEARIAPSGGARRHPITIVRFELSRFVPVLLTARDDGGARTLDRWVQDEHLVAAINASMYEPDGRPSGLCVRRGVDESSDDARFGGFYALDPIGGSASFGIFGRDCPGVDLPRVRTEWQTIVATYRLLDCDGHPIAWIDPDRYSAAAVGLDASDRIVFVHSRAPYRMRELAQMASDASLGLRQLLFVEGGPEATLIVEAGDLHVREVGLPRNLPDGIEPDRDRLYELPNVLGLRAR